MTREDLEATLKQHFFDLRKLSDELCSAAPCDHPVSPATECQICLEVLTSENSVLIKCGHMFHQHCVRRLSRKRCPSCSAAFQTHDLTRVLSGIRVAITTQGEFNACDMARFADVACRLSQQLENATNEGDLSKLMPSTPTEETPNAATDETPNAHTDQTLNAHTDQTLDTHTDETRKKLVSECVVVWVVVLLFCVLFMWELGYYPRVVWNSERCECKRGIDGGGYGRAEGTCTGTSERRNAFCVNKPLDEWLEVPRTKQKRRITESGRKKKEVKRGQEKGSALQGVGDMMTNAIHGLWSCFAWTLRKIDGVMDMINNGIHVFVMVMTEAIHDFENMINNALYWLVTSFGCLLRAIACIVFNILSAILRVLVLLLDAGAAFYFIVVVLKVLAAVLGV